MFSLNPYTHEQILCVVPARMGSTRIKHKNIQELSPGLSLVQQALNTAYGFTTCISTDEPNLFSQLKNILIIERPNVISDAFSNVSLAVQHAHKAAEQYYERDFEIIVTLMPAIAARSSSILNDMLLCYIKNTSAVSSISCARTHPWLWKLTDDNVQNTWHPNIQLNSQDLPLYLVEHSSIIINKRETVMQGLKWKLPLLIYTLPPWAVALDIDDNDDLLHARALYPSVAPLLDEWKGNSYLVNSINEIQPDGQ